MVFWIPVEDIVEFLCKVIKDCMKVSESNSGDQFQKIIKKAKSENLIILDFLCAMN